jgi:hypothetical protein
VSKPIKHKRVERYLKQCLRWLGLGHVRYTLTTNGRYCLSSDGKENCPAQVTIGVRGMQVHFEFACGRPWREVKSKIIHECCHVATYELQETFWNLGAAVGKETYAVAKLGMDDAEERLVIRLERALMSALEDNDDA